MTEERGTAIPVDEFPDPVLVYAVEGRDAYVTTANEAFERRFDDAPPDTPLSAIFERFGVVDTTGDEEPLTHLVRGNRVGLYLDGDGDRGPFFVRVVPSEADTGYLVFCDLRECPDIQEPPAVDQVGSVISHDLRNPLDVAKAHLQAARETGDPEHFESVADAHDRMERIIRDVLTLTREDVVVEPSDRVSIEAAATDAWRSVDTDRSTLDLTGVLPTVTADPGRVRRLFENLFRNSVEQGTEDGDRSSDRGDEAASESGVTVTVGTLENGFYVSDDGPGIPPERREVVFEPGYSTQDGGTGLGLAIVERIVAAHGWTLTLTTAECGGVRFEVRF
ncbi:sensor histidine kinase [Haloplanus pelagicus]|uniref:sensor histidine kinase n=1 Tax=Haloplanus pelagicus TaxID=2949995 RepID=UPI00203B5A07|nr:HAMP domain-containing sensor histidine kinase [Haloplanus sp. HW8-1]